MLQWINKNFHFTRKAAVVGVVFLAVFLFLPKCAGAQVVTSSNAVTQGVQIIQQPLGMPSTDIRLIVVNIIKAALGLLGIVVVVIIIYAGFLWMTAGGNEEQIAKAKKMLINAVIGLAIILSAYGIVALVQRILGIGGGNAGVVGGNIAAPGVQNFEGSGALGGIIKDHYPARDQIGVPRNTKIVVTFRKPVLLSSFVDDTNGDGMLGDCLPNVSDWNTQCDHVKTAAGKLDNAYVNIKQADTGVSISGAVLIAASSTVSGVPGVYTIVIKPITDPTVPSGGYLGSGTTTVSYAVHLGPSIHLDDPANKNPSAFQTKIFGNDYYEWKFTNSTALDTAPPHVTDVFPGAGTTEAKNSIIQINFSEPIDPTGIQGTFNTSAYQYYSLEGGNIFLQSGNSSLPAGSFNITNGYRTLEFAPSTECGVNACGNKIYCLPVCDKTGANCSSDNYAMLLQAGRVISTSSFEAAPFSGVMDLAGNALDGNVNGKPELAPYGDPAIPVREQPDNYYWTFAISDQIDASAPYLQRILPGKDAAYVAPDQEWSMTFSKRMRLDSMYDIGLEEYPAPINGIPLWKVPFSTIVSSTPPATYTKINHGPFLNTSTTRQWYFPIVTSSVEDVHFNCFYPGEGPNQPVTPGTVESPVCNEANRQNCCAVAAQENMDFCCNGDVTSSSVAACLAGWKALSPTTP